MSSYRSSSPGASEAMTADVNELKIDLPSPPPPRKRRCKRVLWLFAGGALLAAAGWIAWKKLPTNGGDDRTVELYVVLGPGGNSGGFAAAGYLEVVPPGPAGVSTLVSARVEQVLAVEGQEVKAGEVLATLFLPPFEIRQKEAEATSERAKARVDLAEKALARNRKLLEIGAAPAKAVEESESELQVARAEEKRAQADLERARMELSHARILSPVAGVVLERLVQPGDWAQQAGSDRPGSTLFRIYDPKRIQAWVDVNQKDMDRIRIGQQATLSTDAQPARAIPGRVLRLLPRANLQKNTVQVKVEIPDPPADLRPDMSVKVNFLPGGEESSGKELTVPARSLVRSENGAYVWVASDGRARRRPVEVGDEVAGKVVVRNGLSPGERIAAQAEGISEGTPLRIRSESK